MARVCPTCEKRPRIVVTRVKLRGKYNPTGKRLQAPNLQWVQIPATVTHKRFKGFAGTRIKTCSKCRRTLLKTNA